MKTPKHITDPGGSGFTRGLRGSVALVLPTAAVGLTFGALSGPVLGSVATVVMSALVWSGTAQFAALSVVAGGGSLALAAATGSLANARYLPMGFALAPSQGRGVLTRVGQGVLLADGSFALARTDRGFDPAVVVGAAPLQWLSWLGGTVVGVMGQRVIGDPDAWGLDVLFPVFYLALLLPEWARGRSAVLTSAVSAVVTLVLVPVAPAGVPVLVASGAALIGVLDPARSRS